jgi:asparagine synthase (glutamine-hydrolysing)
MYVDEKNILELVQTTSDYYDEPFADTSSVPTLALSRMTRAHVTVALSGDGGDELFWGYDKYSHGGYVQYDRFRHFPFHLRKIFGEWLQHFSDQPLGPLGYQLKFRDFVDFYLRKFYLKLDYRYPNLLPGPTLELDHVAASNRDVMSRLGESDRDMLMGAMDLHNYLPDDILTKVDRASMSVGLEVRVPLLDHNIVQLAASIPAPYRSGSGELKMLLKKLLGHYIPVHLWDRPKQGFAVPIGKWLCTSLKSWTMDELQSRQSGLGDWVDRTELGRVLADHLSKKRDNTNIIWAALQFSGWERRLKKIRCGSHVN